MSNASLPGLRALVECPVCTMVRPDCRLYVCVNGHTVCDACKERLSSCPQGHCKYADPPTRNRTAEALARMVDFKINCRHEVSGCPFVSSASSMAMHESACDHRIVPCPHGACKHKVSAESVTEHIRQDHPKVRWRTPSVSSDGLSCSVTEAWLFPDAAAANTTGSNWIPRAFVFKDITFVIRLKRSSQLFYTWVTAVSDSGQTSAMSCDVKVSGNGSDLRLAGRSVYPVDCDRESVMSDESCVQLTDRTVTQCLVRTRMHTTSTSSSSVSFKDEESTKDVSRFKLEVTYSIALSEAMGK